HSDVCLVGVVAAMEGAAPVGFLGDDLAVTPIVGVLPAYRAARLPAFPSVVLGLLSELAIARIERPADLVADDAADHGAGKRAGDAPAAFAELVANDTTGDGAHQGARILLGLTPHEHECRRTHEHRRSHTHLPRPLRGPETRARTQAAANRHTSAMRAPIGAKIRLVRRRYFRAWRGPHAAALGGLRQGQANAEAADFGPAKLEPSAVGVSKVGHDRMAEARAGLGFVWAGPRAGL